MAVSPRFRPLASPVQSSPKRWIMQHIVVGTESERVEVLIATSHPNHRNGIAYQHRLDKLTGFTNL